MKDFFKNNASHLTVIFTFFVLVFFYFLPVWGGKALSQHDVVQAMGSQKELFDYKALTGTTQLWTNSMFGGMPTFQIWYDHPTNIFTYVSRVIRTVFPLPADIIFLYLLGSYFLLCVLKLRPWLAAIGAIAITFSSYNFIYLEAGHVNRVMAIAYITPIIGSVILSYRGNKILGAILLSVFLSLEIRANHVQITYYVFIALLLFVLFELHSSYREKKIKSFIQSSLLQLGAVVIAVAINATVLFPTYEYSKLTTRGQANIVKVEADHKSSGLDRKYAYAWSQGIGENLTFLIPNAYGGKTSGVLGENSNVVKYLTNLGVTQSEAFQIAQRLPTYWGEKSSTSGPWYFGAGIIALFILGLFILRDDLKKWILSVIVLTLLLAFGEHFPIVSDVFFDYVPLYNKFRGPESILIIPSILVPVFAMMTVNNIINPKDEIYDLDKKVLYSFGFVATVCLVVAIMPNVLSLKTSAHQSFVTLLSQFFDGSSLHANQLAEALVKDRGNLASSDAWRSLLFILITFGIIWFYLKKSLSAKVLLVMLGVVTLVDLWTVDKRYLNDDVFVDKSLYRNPIQERQVDRLIRQDKDLSYRVLDLSSNPFSDAKASFFHKSFGGYHAAKLMRFQEVLDHQFNDALNEDVLDMFNVRYIILKDPKTGAEDFQRRSSAAGNAWFVNKVTFVKDNAQEMQAISSFDPEEKAFVHQEFKSKINTLELDEPKNGMIKLTSYYPDRMKYEYTASNDVFAVFSEIYYDKGWKAYVDGEETPIIRTNYILRGLQLPKGDHKIEFVFDPPSMRISRIVSLVGSVVLLLGVVVLIFLRNRKKVI